MSEAANWILLACSVVAAAAAVVKLVEWTPNRFSRRARLRRKAKRLSMPEMLLAAPEDVLALAVREDPPGWEFLLFSELLQAEIRSARDLRLDIQFGRSFEGPVLDEQGALKYVSERWKEMGSLVDRAGKLFNEGVNELGITNRKPVDLDLLCQVSVRIGDLYADALRWQLRLMGAEVPQDFALLFELMASCGLRLAERVEDIGSAIWRAIKAAEADPPPDGEYLQVSLEFDLDDLIPSQANAEIDRLVGKYAT